ncbi:MAG: hypothetical protein M1829_005891 [Trizodia sp. TS-e1964]|nr:MAG: hypothetical protein M1829_005891 [Trizodia sp. TS-e1964]
MFIDAALFMRQQRTAYQTIVGMRNTTDIAYMYRPSQYPAADLSSRNTTLPFAAEAHSSQNQQQNLTNMQTHLIAEQQRYLATPLLVPGLPHPDDVDPFRTTRDFRIPADLYSDRPRRRPRVSQPRVGFPPSASTQTDPRSLEGHRRPEQRALLVNARRNLRDQRGVFVPPEINSRHAENGLNFSSIWQARSVGLPAIRSAFPELDSSRENKRRRHNRSEDMGSKSAISYGFYGQVEPGQLKMEILSCDGGDISELDGRRGSYPAENVLQDNLDVYCTKSNQCNLLMRHQQETNFCVSKIVIKGPRRGFTAPVQEGLVFVSMDRHDLLRRTARYKIHYPSPVADSESLFSLHPISSIGSPELDDNQTAMNASRLLRERNRSLTSVLEQSSEEDSEHCDEPVNGSEQEDLAENIRAEATEFTVTSGSSDEDINDDEEEEQDEGILSATQAQVAIARRHIDGFETENNTLLRSRGRFLLRRSNALRARTRRLSVSNRIEASVRIGENADDQHPLDGALRDQDILAPNARFSIQKNKCRTSVKFDPPL